MNQSTRGRTRWLAGVSLFTALVVILQLLGSFIRFGPFSISLVSIPIVVGAALYGAGAGAWLGFVFGVTVLLSGDASLFLAVSVFGTLVVVLVKGTLCGWISGLIYRMFSKRSDTTAAVISSIVCPIVNTGVFLLGCLVFFLPTIRSWAGEQSLLTYMILGLVGGNFLVELGIDILLCPVIIRLIHIGGKGEKT